MGPQHRSVVQDFCDAVGINRHLRVEDFLQGEDTDDNELLTLILAEIIQRFEDGEAPAFDEYAQRFPRLQRTLQKLFEIPGSLWTDASSLASSLTGPEAEAFRVVAECRARSEKFASRKASPPAANTESVVASHGDTVGEETLIGGVARSTVSPPPLKADDVTELRAGGILDEKGCLGGYRALRVLGRGGMGIVLEMRDPLANRQVAVKAMRPEFCNDAEARARFLREAQAAAALHDDHIMPLFQVGEDRGVLFLVMPLLHGETLEARWRQQPRASSETYARLSRFSTGVPDPERVVEPMEIREALRLAEQTAAGLVSAHKAGLVHRDIKPSNLWLQGVTNLHAKSSWQRAIILDFGLVRFVEHEQSLTKSGSLLGTAAYMAPEQASTRGVDHRADLFSLGVLLYQLLAGFNPFFRRDLMSTLRAIAVDDPPPLSQVNPQVPHSLELLVSDLLKKDPAKRVDDAETLLRRIREVEWEVANKSSKATGKFLQSHTKKRWLVSAAVLTILTFSVLMAWSVVRVKTPEGIIVIETLPGELSGAEILVDGESKILINPNDKSAAISVSVPAGRGELKVRRAGFETITREFSIMTGEQQSLRVRFEPSTRTSNVAAKHVATPLATPPAKPTSPPPGSTQSQTLKNAAVVPWKGWPKNTPSPAIAPFDASQAKAYQESWANHLKTSLDYTNSIGMKFRLIPPGEFMMGASLQEVEETSKLLASDEVQDSYLRSELPRHKVRLTAPFYFGTFEVTQQDFHKVMGRNPSSFAAGGENQARVAGNETTNFPVDSVSWNDAAEFCARLSTLEGYTPSYQRSGETVALLEGSGYRLPTEAEWEFVCRAGTITRFWIGDQEQDLLQSDSFAANSAGTRPVGGLKANPFGVFDLHGNVMEWVQDKWDRSYYSQFTESTATDPRGILAARAPNVIRGGNWIQTSSYSRASRRFPDMAPNRASNVGFRVMLVDVKPKPHR